MPDPTEVGLIGLTVSQGLSWRMLAAVFWSLSGTSWLLRNKRLFGSKERLSAAAQIAFFRFSLPESCYCQHSAGRMSASTLVCP